MRDPKRIPEMLQTLGEIWQIAPDLRLGQIVGNACPGKDVYYIEDDEVLQGLKATLNMMKQFHVGMALVKKGKKR